MSATIIAFPGRSKTGRVSQIVPTASEQHTGKPDSFVVALLSGRWTLLFYKDGQPASCKPMSSKAKAMREAVRLVDDQGIAWSDKFSLDDWPDEPWIGGAA